MDLQSLHGGAAPALADSSGKTGAASKQTGKQALWLRLRGPGPAWLAFLPLGLLAVNSNWIFSGPHRDAWIYYGYYQNAIFYLRQFPDLYYSSRLAVALPGFLAHHMLPTMAANLVLHLALYWAAVLSFYLVVKDLFGARVALLASLALGCHPFFLQAVGWNYVDGFGIAYFLVTLLLLTLASRSPLWRPLLLAAGAMVTALVSTNVFYAVYLPVLAGHFLVLNRQRRQISPLAAALWAGLGAASLFALFSSFTRVLGGVSFYLHASLQFLAGSIGTANVFRDATYSWLPKAVWLVFPAATLLGSAILFKRARTDPSLRRDLPLLWSQVQLVFLVLVALYFQVAGDAAVLQHFYYASLLIPAAFLAFAGQIATLVAKLSDQRFGVLAAVVTLLQVIPLFLPHFQVFSPTDEPSSAPALLALLAGIGAAIALGWRRAGTRVVLAVFLCLAVSQGLVRQEASIFWSSERHGGDGPGIFRQLSQAVADIEAFDPSQDVRLWYDQDAEDGILYDAVASAFLLCPRMINLDFPDLSGGRMCDGSPLAPGVMIAVLSADPSAFDQAAAAIRSVGLSARLVKRDEIEGPSREFTITYLRTEAGAVP